MKAKIDNHEVGFDKETMASVPTRNPITKIQKYGWELRDEPGILKFLSKDVLRIDDDYQRSQKPYKVLEIASAWSWVACGAVLVGERDGKFWVIDGQHRVMAAKKRADITTLPCVVFKTLNVSQEARGFVNANTNRKPISSFDRFKALCVAGDSTALYVRDRFDELGVLLRVKPEGPKSTKCVSWACSMAKDDKDTFDVVLALAAELCTGCPISNQLLLGLTHLHKGSELGLNDEKLKNRLLRVGVEKLILGAKRATTVYGTGGGKVCASGMLVEINKGLHTKFGDGS